MARRTLVLDQPVEAVETTKKKSRKGIYIGIGILALVPVIGSTFAASITLNSGDPIEFGQGQNAVVACDADGVDIMPTSSYNATPSPTPSPSWAGQFTLGAFELSGVDDTNCAGKTFTINAYQSDGTQIDLDSGSGTSVQATVSSGTTTYTVNISNSVDSTLLSKITVETS